jgi:hypothetical protein
MTVMLRIEARYDHDWERSGRIYFQVVPDDERSDRPEDLLVGGFFDIVEGRDVIEQAYFKGRHLSSTLLYPLEANVGEHPEWSNTDIASVLAKAGARYGPDHATEFAKMLNVGRFEGALGKILKTRTQFSGPREEGRPALPLAWIVHVETAGTHGNRNCYSLEFEPINGRLQSLRGRACK